MSEPLEPLLEEIKEEIKQLEEAAENYVPLSLYAKYVGRLVSDAGDHSTVAAPRPSEAAPTSSLTSLGSRGRD